jgi:threonine dehydrogenase-like Zn-dependent dehydrogenase
LGQGHESTEIPTAMLSFREIELVGTRAYTPKNWQTVFHTLLNGEDDLKRIITHRFPLYMAEDGIKKMKNQEGLKIILLP